MITLRAPRFFAFISDLPTIPFPFRGDLSKFPFTLRTKPKVKATRIKVTRSQRKHPAKGAYVMNLSKFEGRGKDIGLRRALFRR